MKYFWPVYLLSKKKIHSFPNISNTAGLIPLLQKPSQILNLKAPHCPALLINPEPWYE